MPAPENNPIVLDYAKAELDDGIPFIRPMRWWRSMCGVCFWGTIVAGFLWPPLALPLAIVAGVTGLLSIIYMGRAALTEVGAGYAARHIALAVALSALLLLGVWLVPPLVHSDLIKWRAAEERDRTAT